MAGRATLSCALPIERMVVRSGFASGKITTVTSIISAPLIVKKELVEYFEVCWQDHLGFSFVPATQLTIS